MEGTYLYYQEDNLFKLGAYGGVQRLPGPMEIWSLLFPMLMYFMYLHRPADIVK